MLVMTRAVGDRILISAGGRTPIVVEVRRIRGGKVRLGVEAPDDFRILRPEYKGRTAAAPCASPRSDEPRSGKETPCPPP
jgi:carbon storage regulator CsrA